MISKIEVKNYRCLRFVSQSIEGFQILVGANASGKTIFLDVVSFISDILSHGLNNAISLRARNFEELTFNGQGGEIEFALELKIPFPYEKTINDIRSQEENNSQSFFKLLEIINTRKLSNVSY